MKFAKRLSRKSIYRGYCFQVVKDQVIWPNGKRLGRDLIIHGGISVIVPVIDSQRIILIRQFRYGAGEYLWELPAGTLRRSETPLACAKREIEEEIGFRAGKWSRLGSCFVSPGFNTEILHCFAAKGLKKTQTKLEEDEILQPHVFTKTEIKRMIHQRAIRDAKSLVALFYFLEV